MERDIIRTFPNSSSRAIIYLTFAVVCTGVGIVNAERIELPVKSHVIVRNAI